MSELSDSFSARWTVTVPKKPPWPDSSTLQQGYLEWYLNCSENRRRIIFLNLECEIPLQIASQCGHSPLHCTVNVESSSTGRVLSTQTVRVDDATSGWTSYRISIGKQRTDDTGPANHDVYSDLKLTFIVTWGIPLQIGPNIKHNPDATVQISEASIPSIESPPESSSTEKYSTADASVQTGPSRNHCLESLLDDFAELWGENANTDVELHCKGHIIKAHKAVLSVRSPVLETMLQTDMVEGRTGVVKINDMAVDTFHSFVRYLYLGKLDALTFDAAVRLYEAGDLYRVGSLVRKCSKYLVDHLTVENSCDILVFADAHDDSSFVDAVIGYMVVVEVPMSADNWKVFCDTHSKLANKVLSRVCEKLSN